jgi:hypothetical protein
MDMAVACRLRRTVMSRILEFPRASQGEEDAATALQPRKARNWKLSPSDFAFLWEECKRCFYLKGVAGFRRPRSILPKIFAIIDSEMKEALANRHTSEIDVSLPAGVLEYGDRWVESRAIIVPGFPSTCFIRGRLDGVIRFEDGSYGVVDFKTAQAKDEHILLYSRQLHAYAWALENPSDGALCLKPISRLGLLVFEPNKFARHNGTCMLSGGLEWIEIPRDDAGFLQFLGEVLQVLEQPEAPVGNPSCSWCGYRDASRRTGL